MFWKTLENSKRDSSGGRYGKAYEDFEKLCRVCV